MSAPHQPPQRIVSLLPSATEMLCLLGLSDRIVGISHECDFPPGLQDRPRVTQSMLAPTLTSQEIDERVRTQPMTGQPLSRLDHDRLLSLAPDLVITQSLCEVCAIGFAEVQDAVRRLPSQPPLLSLQPHTLDDVFQALREIARWTGTLPSAEAVLKNLQDRLLAVQNRSAGITNPRRTLLLEWVDPPFSAGHWSPQLVEWAGGREVLGQAGERSRSLAWEEVTHADPEVLVVACCGFDLARSRHELPLLRQAPGFHDWCCTRNGELYLVDGNAWFSRSGPRLIDGLEILAHTLHPQLHPAPPGLPLAERIPVAVD